MIFSEVKRYLSSIVDVEGVQELGKKKDHILMGCPFAQWTHQSGYDKHPSFMVWFNDEKQTYYKCYSCRECGNLWELFNEYGQKSNQPEMQALALEVLKADTPSISSRFMRLHNKILTKYDLDVVEDEVKYVPESVINKYDIATLAPIANNYLQGRGVGTLTALRFNLRWDKHNYRVCFPVYNQEGCVGMVGRTIPPGDEQAKRYFNYFNFNASTSLGGINFAKDYEYSKVLVLEGYFDLLNVWEGCVELGILPVCTWKASVSESQLTLLAGLGKILICGYDMWKGVSEDKAGNEGYNKFRHWGKLNGVNITRLQLPKFKDCGELTKQELLDSLKSTKTFNSKRFQT